MIKVDLYRYNSVGNEAVTYSVLHDASMLIVLVQVVQIFKSCMFRLLTDYIQFDCQA